MAALLGAGVVLLAVRPLLTRLPEPADATGRTRCPYAALGRLVVRLACALLSAVAVGLAWRAGPRCRRGRLWVVLGTAALLLAAVDARTTWLPLRLTRVAWVRWGRPSCSAARLAGMRRTRRPSPLRPGTGGGRAARSTC